MDLRAAQGRLPIAHPRFRQPEPLVVLSHGLGQDSTALGYLLAYDSKIRERYVPPGGRLLIFASATGSEHEETDRYQEYLAEFFAARGMHYEHITPDRGYHAPQWHSLEAFYAAGNRIGSKSYPRTCTWQLKVSPFYKRLEHLLAEEYGVGSYPGRKRGFYEYVALTGRRIRVLIGFSAEEAGRRHDPQEHVPAGLSNNIERVHPLADLGMTRADCQDYIRARGHPVPPPSWCRFCPWKGELDVLYQARSEPHDYERWVELEANKLAAFAHLPPEKNHGVFPGRTLPEVLEDAESKHGHLTDEELRRHRMTHGHDVGSRY